MEKVIKNYKGVIIFYIIIAVISLIFTIKIQNADAEAQSNNAVQTYFA